MENFVSQLGPSALGSVISALLILVVSAVVIKILTSAAGKLLNRSKKLDGTLQGFIQSAIRILLWIIAVILVCNALGINTSSLVALVSVVGLALSLSVQNILSNLFSGLTLLVTKPFSAGDYVEVAGKAGIIKTVGLFYTQLDTLDNVAISIPNSDVTSSAVNNYNREPMRRVDMTFNASYADDTEAVRAAILDACAQDSRIVGDPAPFVRISGYNASSVAYVVRVWCQKADYWDVYFGLNENVRESFKRNGVHMTFEHVNVHLVEK